MSEHEYAPGDVARDQGRTDDEELEAARVVVLETTGMLGSEAVVYKEADGSDHTVADYHDGRFADSPVVKVCYHASLHYHLRKSHPEWDVETVLGLYESGELTKSKGKGGCGIMAYSFPEARLRPESNE